MINSNDVDRCIVDARATVRVWTEEFKDAFYRRQREAAIGSWFASIPPEVRELAKFSNPDLYKRMEEGNYGS